MNIKLKLLINISICIVIFGCLINAYNTMYVKANGSRDVKTEYDNTGKLISISYYNGTKIIYEYDENGNIVKLTVVKGDNNASTETADTISSSEAITEADTTSSSEAITEADTTSSSEAITEADTTSSSEAIAEADTALNSEETSESSTSLSSSESEGNSDSSGELYQEKRYTPGDLEGNVIFKKKRPTIKALKYTSPKRFIKIKVKNITIKGMTLGNGYQVRYSTSSGFKKSKVFTFSRSYKGRFTQYTYKKKRLVKNKTYYVKVRAYKTLKNGKVIYSKYSKVKKIKVK